MEDKIVYNFASSFTDSPGPRYRTIGDKSGEEFREDILKPLLNKYKFIEIDGSGILTSFNPSFLSEAFIPLADEIGGVDELFKRIRLYSPTNPKLEEKFHQYVALANSWYLLAF